MHQNIEVLLSSGDVDSFARAHDAIVDPNGALHVVEAVTEESQLDRRKTITITTEIDNGMDRPPGTRITPYLLLTTYAPGMWMKVSYSDALMGQGRS